ncbi:unnamed protein product [Schistosoma mattheei]|uniref:Uncharacterized protein n=1 Tax=Schistosoma mattheei TaxID=31246 RepID=A0A183NWJ6_9TREM|nr:unnamed protein product [Schistosoma mattheei]
MSQHSIFHLNPTVHLEYGTNLHWITFVDDHDTILAFFEIQHLYLKLMMKRMTIMNLVLIYNRICSANLELDYENC